MAESLEDKGQADRYVFGFEESCGYLKGTYVRDKDGVVASMLLCQCAAYHKKQGKTLADRLAELEEQLGTFLQQTVSYAFGGVDGAQRTEQLFVQLRQTWRTAADLFCAPAAPSLSSRRISSCAAAALRRSSVWRR